MKRYSVLLAYDVPCYATIIVEADSPEEAERIAMTDKAACADFEPSWDASSDVRLADDAEEVDENDLRPVR